MSLLDIIMYLSGLIILLLFIIFFFIGLKYKNMFDNLEEKEFPLKEVYFVGYAMLEVFKYQYKSKADRKLRKEISVLYGEKYAEFYIRVIYAQRLTLAFIIANLAIPMYGLADDALVSLVILVMSGLAFYYYGTVTANKIKERSEEMLSEFSNVVSKLALLTNAGMIMREAWEEVAYTGESTLYVEMQMSVDDMKNGMSESDALFKFGSRCIIPEIKKFTSTIIQGIEKGNSELTFMLKDQSKELWGLKKQDVKRQGEKAASKLLIPIMVMFVGIIIMVVVPIFGNLGM